MMAESGEGVESVIMEADTIALSTQRPAFNAPRQLTPPLLELACASESRAST